MSTKSKRVDVRAGGRIWVVGRTFAAVILVWLNGGPLPATAGNIICASPSAAFNAECETTLDSIRGTEVGNALLGEIETSDRTVLVGKEDRPLHDGINDEPKSKQVTVLWQAAEIVEFKDDLGVFAVPKASLFHELVHALLVGSETKDIVLLVSQNDGVVKFSRRDLGNEVIATVMENIFRQQAMLADQYGLRTHYGPRQLPTPTPTPTPACGNSVVEGTEQCDGAATGTPCDGQCIAPGQANECTCACGGDLGTAFINPLVSDTQTLLAEAPATGTLRLTISGTACFSGGCPPEHVADYAFFYLADPIYRWFGVVLNGTHRPPDGEPTVPAPDHTYVVHLPIAQGEPLTAHFSDSLYGDNSGGFTFSMSLVCD